MNSPSSEAKHVHYDDVQEQDEAVASSLRGRSSSYSRLRQSVASLTSSVLPPDYAAIILDSNTEYRRVLYQVIYVGISFALIFTSSMVQSFLTTLYPEHGYGYTALALIQLFFGLSSFIVPSMCSYLGVVNSMFLGALTYPLLTASINTNQAFLVLIASVLNGIGAGFLWIGQGIWLTKLTTPIGSIGTFTGIFFTLFNLNGIFGNVATLILQELDISFSYITWTIAAASAIGAMMIFFVQDHSSRKCSSAKIPIAQRLYQIVSVAKMKKTLLLSPYICAQGLSLAYSAGNLPEYANQDEKLIVYILLAFGIAATITSFICGSIYDKFGMKPLMAIHLIIVVAQYLSIFLCIDSFGLDLGLGIRLTSIARTIILTFLGASYGILDYLINTIVNISISKHYDPDLMPSGFSYMRLFSCLSYAGSAFITPHVPNYCIVLANIVFCVLSILCYSRFESIVEHESIFHERSPLVSVRSRASIDPLRLSVASIACLGPARPSVISIADIISEEVAEHEDLEDHD